MKPISGLPNWYSGVDFNMNPSIFIDRPEDWGLWCEIENTLKVHLRRADSHSNQLPAAF